MISYNFHFTITTLLFAGNCFESYDVFLSLYELYAFIQWVNGRILTVVLTHDNEQKKNVKSRKTTCRFKAVTNKKVLIFIHLRISSALEKKIVYFLSLHCYIYVEMGIYLFFYIRLLVRVLVLMLL